MTMKTPESINVLTRLFFTCLLAAVCTAPAFAQQKYTPASIHSHNDYSRPEHFYHAFNAGVGAIEADVYLRNGKLMVAHDSTEIKPDVTLKSWYIIPFEKELSKRPRPVNFLIDFKEPYVHLLPALLHELEPLKSFIRSDDHPQAPLTIIITGNRPPPSEYNNYPPYILFDDDLQMPHTQQQWQRVAQVSLNFAYYSKWKGEGLLPSRDEKILKAIINMVHLSGKKIRFWGAPDTPACWQKLMNLGADILSTDKIDQVVAFIK